MKTICVTGSGGFIASHTIEALQKRGYGTIGIQRHIGAEQFADIIYLGDLKDKEVVEKAIRSATGVIHLASILGTQETVKNPYPSVEVNILGTLNVLEACRIGNVPMVYIAVGNHWMNNSYSITKTCGERFCLMYANEHGVKVNVVRGLNAFGERQKAYPIRKMLPSFITRAIKNETIQIYGDGEQEMDFVYVKDVAGVLIKVLRTELTYGNIFEAGLGFGHTVNVLAEKIIQYAGSSSDIEHLPMRPGEEAHSIVIAENPYPYDYTDLDGALRKTVEWYQKQG